MKQPSLQKQQLQDVCRTATIVLASIEKTLMGPLTPTSSVPLPWWHQLDPIQTHAVTIAMDTSSTVAVSPLWMGVWETFTRACVWKQCQWPTVSWRSSRRSVDTVLSSDGWSRKLRSCSMEVSVAIKLYPSQGSGLAGCWTLRLGCNLAHPLERCDLGVHRCWSAQNEQHMAAWMRVHVQWSAWDTPVGLRWGWRSAVGSGLDASLWTLGWQYEFVNRQHHQWHQQRSQLHSHAKGDWKHWAVWSGKCGNWFLLTCWSSARWDTTESRKMWECHNLDNGIQHSSFRWYSMSQSCFIVDPGKCVTTPGNDRSVDQQLRLWDRASLGYADQRYHTGLSYYGGIQVGKVSLIRSFDQNTEASCADVVGGQFVAGTKLQVWTCYSLGSSTNQEFLWWKEEMTTFEGRDWICLNLNCPSWVAFGGLCFLCRCLNHWTCATSDRCLPLLLKHNPSIHNLPMVPIVILIF